MNENGSKIGLQSQEPGASTQLNVSDLQAEARTQGGRIMTPDEFRPYLGELHHMLEGVEYVTIDTTGRVGYHSGAK